MSIRGSRHRLWIVRRVRFQNNKGAQVTDTWLNVPLLPRRILSWRSQDRRWGEVRFTSGFPVTDLVIPILVAVGIYQKVSTGQWQPTIADCLIIVAAFLMLARLWRQKRQQPERRASHI